MQLHSAYNAPIETYGTVRRTIDFSLPHPFTWSFWKADVPYTIFGADAMIQLDLLPDLKRKRLIDNVTRLYAIGALNFQEYWVLSSHFP